MDVTILLRPNPSKANFLSVRNSTQEQKICEPALLELILLAEPLRTAVSPRFIKLLCVIFLLAFFDFCIKKSLNCQKHAATPTEALARTTWPYYG